MSSIAASAPVTNSTSPDAFQKLRRFNLGLGVIHLAQAVAVLLLSNGFTLPVGRTFLSGPPGTAPTTESWFDLPLGPAVAAFLLLASIDHFLMAAPKINDWYNGMLARNRNDARWIEYSISASLMIVLIAMICGVSDIGALIAIAGVNASMIFFGLLQEVFTRPGKGINWMPYIYGCFAGAIPWAIIALQIASAEARATDGGVPGFVYGIIISLFLLFNSFAVNMVLQYKQVGRWRDYLYGEKVYLLLSLTAKTLLAWQVFANVLVS
jgi:Heliorhodopsin